MKKIFLLLLEFLFFYYCCAQQQFQLAPPVINYSSVFFKKSTTVPLKFDLQGAKIYYTLDQTEPTEKKAAYISPLVITKNLTTLKAKAFCKGFLPSETVQAIFIKDGLKIKKIDQPAASAKFQGRGGQTLFDNQGGVADLNNKNFLGYQQDSVVIHISLAKRERIDSVLIDFLQDHGGWVFLPQKIEVYCFDERQKKYEMVAHREIASNAVINSSSVVFEMLRSKKKIIADDLRILIEPLQSMPEGHPGKGKQSWLFLDEIKIY